MICVLFMRSLLIFIMLQDFLLIPMSLLTLYNSLCFLQHQWVLDCTLKIVMYREKFKIILQFLFSRRDKIVLQKHKTISFPFSLSYPEEQFLSKFWHWCFFLNLLILKSSNAFFVQMSQTPLLQNPNYSPLSPRPTVLELSLENLC